MRQAVLSSLKKGQTLSQLATALGQAQVSGRAVTVSVDDRSMPWVDHVVEGWVDGPPGSNVVAVVSGRDPELSGKWRRFTVTRVAPWHLELDAFPTPFNNGVAPLSPGIPPGASRPA